MTSANEILKERLFRILVEEDMYKEGESDEISYKNYSVKIEKTDIGWLVSLIHQGKIVKTSYGALLSCLIRELLTYFKITY